MCFFYAILFFLNCFSILTGWEDDDCLIFGSCTVHNNDSSKASVIKNPVNNILALFVFRMLLFLRQYSFAFSMFGS